MEAVADSQSIDLLHCSVDGAHVALTATGHIYPWKVPRPAYAPFSYDTVSSSRWIQLELGSEYGKPVPSTASPSCTWWFPHINVQYNMIFLLYKGENGPLSYLVWIFPYYSAGYSNTNLCYCRLEKVLLVLLVTYYFLCSNWPCYYILIYYNTSTCL